jgi:indolepyruvate ferredoxin oxidoreductase beta subunit
LTVSVARYLALWMSYEDTIRVADLKTRSARFDRFRKEVRAADDQIVYVTEFMHPRFEEVCETLPAGLGGWMLGSSSARRMLAPLFRKGRHINTARLTGFFMLHAVAGMRRFRRSTLRYRVEEQRITSWLARIHSTVAQQGRYDVALEISECQRLVKGYSDTHERGLRNYQLLMRVVDAAPERGDLAEVVRRLRNAALADDEGIKLAATLTELQLASSA